MHLAILGATSQIAKDLILSFAANSDNELSLFARKPEVVRSWLENSGLSGRYRVAEFAAFGADAHFDALLNFVGVGNPAQAAAMGASIFDVTLDYDDIALAYLRRHPECRYIFLSSGAAYGSSFDKPADEFTKAVVAINNLQPHDWYAAAKLHAECRHRSLAHLPIVDLRVFNYFSQTQDISARFLITDIVRAIRDEVTLKTTPDYIVRDYLHPADFHELVSAVLSAPVANLAVDCYTRAPIDKLALLETMRDHFGLRYEIGDASASVNATGNKPHYYSRNTRASALGYQPAFTSAEGIMQESSAMLARIRSGAGI